MTTNTPDTPAPSSASLPAGCIVPSDAQIEVACANLIYRFEITPSYLKVFDKHTGVLAFNSSLLGYSTDCTYDEIVEAWVIRQLPFCSTDCPHSLTRQLLAKVEAAGTRATFWQAFALLWHGTEGEDFLPIPFEVFSALQAPPKVIAVACLLALDAWPSTWRVPTP